MHKKTNALRMLDALGIAYALTEYRYDPEHLGVDQIAKENKLELERVFKTLVAKGDKGIVVVAVIPGDKSLDFKVLARLVGSKKIALADAKDLQNLSGYIRGGCAPIGMKKDYPVFIDEAALLHECIYVNAGTRGLLMELPARDLAHACCGEFAVLT